MSGELTITLKVAYAKSGSSFTAPDEPKREQSVTVSGTKLQHNRQSIATTETALNLGGVTTGGWFVAVNRDATNFVSLRSGTGATNFAKLKAGEACAFRISGSASAPYAIADTSAVELEFWLVSD